MVPSCLYHTYTLPCLPPYTTCLGLLPACFVPLQHYLLPLYFIPICITGTVLLLLVPLYLCYYLWDSGFVFPTYHNLHLPANHHILPTVLYTISSSWTLTAFCAYFFYHLLLLPTFWDSDPYTCPHLLHTAPFILIPVLCVPLFCIQYCLFTTLPQLPHLTHHPSPSSLCHHLPYTFYPFLFTVPLLGFHHACHHATGCPCACPCTCLTHTHGVLTETLTLHHHSFYFCQVPSLHVCLTAFLPTFYLPAFSALTCLYTAILCVPFPLCQLCCPCICILPWFTWPLTAWCLYVPALHTYAFPSLYMCPYLFLLPSCHTTLPAPALPATCLYCSSFPLTTTFYHTPWIYFRFCTYSSPCLHLTCL